MTKLEELAEELAHHKLNYGDIIDQGNISNRRQERKFSTKSLFHLHSTEKKRTP